ATLTISRKWDPETESLVPCTFSEVEDFVNAKGGWREIYEKHLMPYRQSAGSGSQGSSNKEDAWPHLTQHISPTLLTRFTNNEGWRISSASSGLQDRDEIPGLSAKEVESVIGGGDEEGELGMLGVDLRVTWPEGAVGRERTEMARDTSWKVGDVVRRLGVGDGEGEGEGEGGKGRREWGDVILGQMEICFLMVLTLANYSCLEEWKRCLGLVLRCEKLLEERPGFFIGALRLLRGQLARVDDVEGGLFDMSDDGGGFLRELLKGFKRTLERVCASGDDGCDEIKEEFEEIEQWVKEHYGWELGGEFVRSGMLELEDGEVVEMETTELEEEDESGEYAPVVVDLG
ncbi:MAG: hypothetical protein Q9222_006542, partial [Ikaeria aurantiellina]